MDAGQDALHTHGPPLGSISTDAELGPISPELALVDPELAQRAREFLPEPRERPKPRPPVAPIPAPEPPAEPEVRRRWPRTLALAIVIFVAGAASGTLLGNHQSGAPGTRLEVRAAAPAPTSISTPQPTTTKRAALRPPKVPHPTTTAKRPPTRKPKASRPKTPASLPPQRRRHSRRDWATNVLGVEARVGRDGVLLLWLRPADSARVLVLRSQEARSGSTVVYRGRAARFHDPSARPCTGYRYTIVNVDRHGHRSTGVPTAVTTLCT